GLLTGLDLLGI
nr:lanosterol 14 alpha-demethylase, cytochrome P-45014DM [swine, liver microsomes, Peptide Partial, 11 aa] [Sus scrofa]